MSQFFVSCKESRIENNRSFYGCFHLGPFEPSQSLTIANTLRRTLLSEIYGLAIVSVEIEGANHEYSSLPGVYESVLDILLNLKEIVLKKTIKNFSPQIGYLRVRGPGVVLASHLRLPPFIQCVDPDQYIANLSHNGFLNMKFIIQYGNKWLSPINSVSSLYKPYTEDPKNPKTLFFEKDLATQNTNPPPSVAKGEGLEKKEQEQNDSNIGNFNTDALPPILKGVLQQQSQKNHKDIIFEDQKYLDGKIQPSNTNFFLESTDSNNLDLTKNKDKQRDAFFINIFNLHFKKRRLFIKKLKDFGISGSNSYIDMFSKSFKKLLLGASNTFNKSLCSSKYKRFLFFKTKKNKNLRLILKINKQYPGINLKTGSIVSNSFFLNSQTFKKSLKNTKIKANLLNNKNTVQYFLEQKIEKKVNQQKKKSNTLLKPKLLVEGAVPPKVVSPQTQENYWNREVFYDYKDTKLTSKKKLTHIFMRPKNINKKIKTSHSKLTKQKIFFNVNSLNIDAIFNPIIKVNYIIEINDFKVAQNKIQNAFQSSELYDTLIGTTNNTIIPHLKNNDWNNNSVSYNKIKSSLKNRPRIGHSFEIDSALNSNDFKNLLKLNQEISLLTKETLKHNIILEIWTNGSMHPRDALYQAFKNLIKIFLKLKNVQPFGVNQLLIKGPHSTDIQSNVDFPVKTWSSEINNHVTLLPILKGVEATTKNRETVFSQPFFKPKNNKKDSSKKIPFLSATLPLNMLVYFVDFAKQNQQNIPKQQFKESSTNLFKDKKSSVQKSSFATRTDLLKMNHILFKKAKRGELTDTFLEKLQPLNDISFLSAYINSKFKNYYFNQKNNFILLNNYDKKEKIFIYPIFITGKRIPDIFTTLYFA